MNTYKRCGKVHDQCRNDMCRKIEDLVPQEDIIPFGFVFGDDTPTILSNNFLVNSPAISKSYNNQQHRTVLSSLFHRLY